jgi:hypothetical protein
MSFLKPKAAKSTQSSTSSSESGNLNNGLITSTFTPAMQAGSEGVNFLGQMLGIHPSTLNAVGNGANAVAEAGGAPAGYQNYLQMAGYAPALRQLSQGITGQGAASGLLRSGSTTNALLTRGADLNSQYFNNYLQNLTNYANLGLNAGNLVSNAGQYSKSTSTSTGSSTGGSPSTIGTIGSTIGGIASIFSDRRLKTGIRKLREFADGLGIYSYRYHGHAQRFIGVMADEVARLRPWALGPTIAGFQTVNYGAL